jgi:catechol 2,3-dioxygenase-like lactoylglutathione lyase family enzyme
MADQTRNHITKIGRVLVPVTDQDRALEFYTATLGFEKRYDMAFGAGGRWIEVAPAGAQTVISLIPPQESLSPGAATGILLTSEDVDADHADLKTRGVDVDAEVTRPGPDVPPMFFFRDPDGNSLCVVG